jgi:hypothetical protein
LSGEELATLLGPTVAQRFIDHSPERDADFHLYGIKPGS